MSRAQVGVRRRNWVHWLVNGSNTINYVIEHWGHVAQTQKIPILAHLTLQDELWAQSPNLFMLSQFLIMNTLISYPFSFGPYFIPYYHKENYWPKKHQHRENLNEGLK